MIRKLIYIDEEKCNGCGACAEACHEGAIAMVNGKAKLMREDYCDGFGDCLPACPAGAIRFEEREAPAYDAQAVRAAKAAKADLPQGHGCPGSMVRTLERPTAGRPGALARGMNAAPTASALRQWPVQLKLVSPNAPYFDGAHMLVAADCTAYAYGEFHNDFIRNRVCVVGCPKLDGVDYTEKLQAILMENDVRSLTIVRMEVPCCGGLERAAKDALRNSGKFIPWQVVTLSVDGRVLED